MFRAKRILKNRLASLKSAAYLLALSFHCLLTAFSCFSQPGQIKYKLIQYTNDNGLDQESIAQMRIGPDGFLWLINNSGMVRFDGKVFSTAKLPVKNRLISFHKSLHGDQLYVKDGENNVLQIANGQVSLANNVQSAPNLFYDSRRTLTFLTKAEDKLHTAVTKRFVDKNNGVFITPNREFYFQEFGKDSVFCIANNQLSSIKLDRPNEGFRFLLHDTLFFLNQSGTIDRITRGKLISQRLHIGKNLQKLIPDILSGKIKSSMHYELVYFDSRDALLYVNASLYKIKVDNNVIDAQVVVDELPAIKDVSGIVCYPSSNTYFISSYSQGLFQIQPTSFRNIQSNLGILYENNLMAIMPLDSDLILSARNVLYGKDRKASKGPFPHLQMYGIAKGKNNDVYLSEAYNDTNRLIRYNPFTGSKREIYKKIEFAMTCSATNAFGELFISDFTNIYKVSGNDVKKLVALPFWGTHDFHIFSFRIRNKDEILIGTTRYLLNYHLSTGLSDTLLKDTYVRSIYKDKAGNYFIGSYGNGHYLYLEQSKKLVKLPTDELHSLNFTHNFFEDKLGYIWSSTNNGLFRYKSSDVYAYTRDTTARVNYARFDNSNGLLTNEFNGGANPSSVLDFRGNLLLSSINGIVSFVPEQIQVPVNRYPILIEKVVGDARVYSLDSNISFAHNVANIRIYVASSQIGLGRNSHLQYQVFGISDEWIPVNETGEISFSGLKNGRYKIIVRKDSNGECIETEFSFVVRPSFVQTPAFYLLLLGIFLLAFGIFDTVRMRILNRKKQLLQKLIAEKTSHLNQTISELTASYKIIEKAANIVLHDLRSPLKFIATISGRLLKNKGEHTAEVVYENLSVINSASIKVYQFSENLLGWLSSKADVSSAKFQYTDLSGVLTEITEVYGPIIQGYGNQLISTIAPECMARTNADLISIVIRNALDNANKYTRKGEIQLILEEDDDRMTIIVKDNGRGFDVGKAMEKMKQDRDETLGLRIMTEISTKLNALYKFESEPGKGTTFHLILLKDK